MIETILLSSPFLKPDISNVMSCYTGSAQKCHCNCLIPLCCTLDNIQKDVKYTLFYKQCLFQLSLNVAYVFLNTFRHHPSKTLLMFSIFMSVSICLGLFISYLFQPQDVT